MNKMSGIYSTGKICPFAKQNCTLSKEGLSLEPGKKKIIIFKVTSDNALNKVKKGGWNGVPRSVLVVVIVGLLTMYKIRALKGSPMLVGFFCLFC